MIRIAVVLLVALAGCKEAPEKKEPEPAAPTPTPAVAPAPAPTPVPVAEQVRAPESPVLSAADAALIEKARAVETRAIFPEAVKKPFVPMQDKLVDYLSKVASNPSPAVTMAGCRTASKARCVFIDAPCTGGCDVNGMSLWLRPEGDKLVLDTALLGDIPIKSEADIDAVYREIDGE